MFSRRALLRSSVLWPLGVATGAVVARAFSIETPALALSEELMAARAQACQAANGDHAALRARLATQLADSGLSPEQRTRLAATVCPLCGCPAAP